MNGTHFFSKLLKYYVDSDEILDALNKDCVVMKYSELYQIANLFEVFTKTNRLVLLIESSIGRHFICLVTNNNKKILTYFDSYGRYIDETMKLINSTDTLLESYINDFINKMRFKLDVNKYHFQHEDNNVCGRYCISRCILDKMTNIEYKQLLDMLTKKNNLDYDELICVFTFLMTPLAIRKLSGLDNDMEIDESDRLKKLLKNFVL